MKFLKRLVKSLTKKILKYGERFVRTKVSLFGKELPNDVGHVVNTSKLVPEGNQSISDWGEEERDFKCLFNFLGVKLQAFDQPMH